MKKILFCLLLVAAPLQATAEPRAFNQGELDALLAPIALYPDALLNQVLEASTRPGQVAQAARWTRGNPQLSGEEAVNAAQSWGWHPSVTSLVAFPDVLQRMDENPQWLADLSEAYRESEPYVMETVQQLRRRAEAAGNLRSDERQQVVQQGDTLAVQPVYPQYMAAPYYNPLVVFGTWWWTTYRPVVWRPWVPRWVVWTPRPRRHIQPVHPVARPIPVVPVRPLGHRTIVANNGAPSPAVQMQSMQAVAYLDRQRAFAAPPQAVRIPVAQAQPAPRVHVRPVVHQAVVHPQAQVASRPGVVHSGGGARPLGHAGSRR